MNKTIARLARPLVAAGLLLLAATGASAIDITEGSQYQLVRQPGPATEVAKGKVEVVEFFWYACPHCYAIQPKVEAWLKKGLPANAQYVWIPATWNDLLKTHARVYYTIQALGRRDLHDEVFREINVRGDRLETPEKIEAFFVAHGVTQAAFEKAFASFAVDNRVRQAEAISRRFQITGTPTWVVGGKYLTDVQMAGSEDALFQVVNALVAKAARGG